MDPLHIFSTLAQDWFARNANSGWATCPLTENGFVRILSQPTYRNSPGGVAAALPLLHQLCSLETHRFWADEVSIRDVLTSDPAVTPSQITDLYLLGLAVRHGGKLATFDARVPASVVQGGAAALELIAP